jgi:4-diphosphocytidyl-2C-methyl-D-erythritol kinase
VPTTLAYRLFDEQYPELQRQAEPIGMRDESDRVSECVRSGDYAEFCRRVHNDFDPVIRHALPDVARAHERLQTAGADATVLCGSGSTVAGFFRSVADAEVAISQCDLAPGEWAGAAGFADDE